MTVNGGRGEGNSRAGSPGVERRCRGVASNNSIAVDENNSEKERKCSPHQRRPGEGEEKLGGEFQCWLALYTWRMWLTVKLWHNGIHTFKSTPHFHCSNTVKGPRRFGDDPGLL